MTLHAIVRHARAQLAAAGIPAEEAAMDADLLARHALGWDLATLISRAADEAPEGFETRFAALIDRRLRREPVAYIRGTQEFWGRDFVVGPGVLIPRPETEFIIEEAIAWAATHARSSASTRADGSGPAPLRILDIGAGSGCIAVTLALELPGAHVAATDTSPDALDPSTSSSRTRPTSPSANTPRSNPRCATSSRLPRSSPGRMDWMRFAASCRPRRRPWPRRACC
jgi:release factor glutamine methyltransferase